MPDGSTRQTRASPSSCSHLLRLPRCHHLQRTRSLPDFYPQRSSFITWLLARRRSIR